MGSISRLWQDVKADRERYEFAAKSFIDRATSGGT